MITRPPLQRPTLFDIEQEQMRHNDVLNWLGEMTCFIDWWRTEDFEAGLVTRCSQCYIPLGDVTDAFRQPSRNKCPQCFGTTFEGGIHNLWFRPALWDLTPVNDDVVRRGDVQTVRGSIEAPSDIDIREGDTAVRCDGTRWQLDQPVWQEITSGFGSQKGQQTRRLRSKASILKEDPTSTVYLPVVDFDALNVEGWMPYISYQPHRLDRLSPKPTIHAVASAAWSTLIGKAQGPPVPASASAVWGGMSGIAYPHRQLPVVVSAVWGAMDAVADSHSQFVVAEATWGMLSGIAYSHSQFVVAEATWGTVTSTAVALVIVQATPAGAFGAFTTTAMATRQSPVQAMAMGTWGALTATTAATHLFEATAIGAWGTLTGSVTAIRLSPVQATAMSTWGALTVTGTAIRSFGGIATGTWGELTATVTAIRTLEAKATMLGALIARATAGSTLYPDADLAPASDLYPNS